MREAGVSRIVGVGVVPIAVGRPAGLVGRLVIRIGLGSALGLDSCLGVPTLGRLGLVVEAALWVS